MTRRGDEPGGESPIVVPGYVTGEQLGAGGFGEVYRARHAVIGRDVAIKILHAKFSANASAGKRFVDEARAVNQISHPNIVEIFDLGTLSDGRQFYVMELITGTTLRDLLRQRDRLPIDEALPILRGIADAVDAAHAAGIAHRDLKPENVFVLPDGGIKLIDFGLAKLTREDDVAVTETGTALGTPLYMSPEQCRGRNVALSTDAYSFGVLAYHVLTGETPFSGDPLELALHHLNDKPRPPSAVCAELDAKTDRVIAALMAKEPTARPASLRTAVDALVGDAPLPPRPHARRRRWLLIGSALALIATSFGLVMARQGEDEVEFTVKPQVVRFDGLAFLDGLQGGDVYYRDDSGQWRYSIATGAVDRFTVPEGTKTVLHDGRFVVVRDGKLVIADPAGARELPGLPLTADHMTPSRDDRQLAYLDGEWLAVYDITTASTRRLVRRTWNSPNLAWSPDGTRLLWDSNAPDPTTSRVHVTRVADGETRVVALPLLAEEGMSTVKPAEFYDAQHIVYCAAGEPSGTIRMRDLDDQDPAHERVLAHLDPAASTCLLATDRTRIVVLVVRHKPSVAIIDLAEPNPQMRLVAGTSARRMLDEVGQGDTLIARDSTGFVHIALDGTIQPASGCAGGGRFVRRGNELAWLETERSADATSVRLSALPACTELAAWRLPRSSGAAFACGARACFGALRIDDHVTLFRLAPGESAHPFGRGSEANTAHLSELAISPDEQTIVLGVQRGELLRVDADGTLAKIPFDGNVSTLAWGRDANHVLVGTQEGAAHATYGLVELGLDGSAQRRWSSPTMWVGGLRAFGDGHRYAATVRAHQFELLVLEPK